MDDVILNAPTVPGGKTVRSEDIGGIEYQVVKLALGINGVNDGDVSATNPLPVTGTLTVDKTGLATDAKQDTGNTALAAILSKIISAPATSAKQDSLLAELQLKADLSETQPVSLATNTPDVTDRAARLLGHVTVDNASLPVTGTFFQTTQPVSAASLPLPSGAATSAKQDLLATQATLELIRVLLAGTLNNDMTDRAVRLLGVLSAGSNIIGKVGIDQTTPGTTNKVSVGTDTVTTKATRSTSSSVTNASVTTSSSTALAINTSRLGATFWNDGADIVYLKLGATASATSYTVQLDSGDYYELPFFYTGIVDVIASASTATLRITELS